MGFLSATDLAQIKLPQARKLGLLEARDLLGTANLKEWWWDGHAMGDWTFASFGGGAAAYQPGGLYRLTGGAGGDNLAQLKITAVPVGNLLTSNVYMQYRAKNTDAAAGDTQAIRWFGSVYIGHMGPGLYGCGSDANFSVIKYDGGAFSNVVASTVALDANWHTVRFAAIGGTGYLSVDGEAWCTGALAGAAAPLQLEITCYNRSGIAHNPLFDISYLQVAAVRV